MMEIHTSPIYIGILTLMMMVFGVRVSALRNKFKVSLGTGDQPELQRAVRVFGNMAEWIPMILITLVVSEMLGAPQWLIHVVGIALIVGRLATLPGIRPDQTNAARAVAAMLTLLSALVTGGYLVYVSVA